MSLVTPNPAAEFSALAITNSTPWCVDETLQPLAQELAARTSDDVADEKEPHAGGVSEVVTGTRCARPRRSRSFGRITVSSPDCRRGAGPADVEGARQPHRARKTPEIPLHQVIGRFRDRRGGRLLAGHDEHAVPEQHPQRPRRHAARVHHQLDRRVGFEDVDEGPALTGVGRRVGAERAGQVVEKLANVLAQFAGFARRKEREVGHRGQSWQGQTPAVKG